MLRKPTTYFGHVLMTFSAFALIFPPVAHSQAIRLIVRGDDFGMTEGNLEAIEQAMNHGVMTCTSIIVPSPWFEGATALARRNPGWCTGIHLCLTGEWRGYRWRPVLPWDKVPSLVDADGYFYGSPRELFGHHPKLEEIDREFRAQIELAKRKGVQIAYLDSHYFSPSDYPGLEEVIAKIARDYGLVRSERLGEKEMRDVYSTPLDQKLKTTVQELEGLGPGLWLWVVHAGIDSPEQRALVHTLPQDIFGDGGVGLNRAEELRVVTSLEVRSAILKKEIQLTTYRDLAKSLGTEAH